MKFYMMFIVAALSVSLIVTGTVTVAPAQNEINYTELVEDLEAMCRITDKTIYETFEKDYMESGFFGRHSCLGAYLKCYGVILLLDVQFPMTDKEIKVLKTEKETDLWDQFQREVRHQPKSEEAKWVADKNEVYDEDKIDELKEKLAYPVGAYNTRIGQFESDDTIPIVVFGRSGHRSDFDQDFDLYLEVLGNTEARIRTPKKRIHQDEIMHRRKQIENKMEKRETDSVPRETARKLVIASPPPLFPFGSYGKPATTTVLSHLTAACLRAKKAWTGRFC